MSNLNEEFVEEYGADAFDTLFSCIYGDVSDKRFDVIDRTYSNRINSSGTVYFYPYYSKDNFGKEIIITYRDGDWNGSEILDYGENIKPLRHTQMIRHYVQDTDRIRNEALLQGLLEEEIDKRIRLHAKKISLLKDKIDDMARKHNYDAYFSPTNKIDNYYKEYLHDNYLKVEWEEVECN